MSRSRAAKPARPRNFVAKHAVKTCRAAVHKDKKKDYERRPRNQKGKADLDADGV